MDVAMKIINMAPEGEPMDPRLSNYLAMRRAHMISEGATEADADAWEKGELVRLHKQAEHLRATMPVIED